MTILPRTGPSTALTFLNEEDESVGDEVKGSGSPIGGGSGGAAAAAAAAALSGLASLSGWIRGVEGAVVRVRDAAAGTACHG